MMVAGGQRVRAHRLIALLAAATLAALLATGCEDPFAPNPKSPPPQSDDAPQTQSLGLRLLSNEAYRSARIARAPTISTPRRADLSGDFPTVGDQGSVGSCVGWAVAYALKSYHERVERGWPLSQRAHLMSPCYLYNQIKVNGGGAYFVDAFNLLLQQGVSSLAMMPCGDPFNDELMPSDAARREAADYKIASWGAVSRGATAGYFVEEIKRHLVSGVPIVAAIPVYHDFDVLDRFNDTYDDGSGPNRGYHAIAIVGYDDDKSAFRLINSWGASWGVAGYGWIDYDFSYNHLVEAYVLTDRRGARPFPGTPTNPTPAHEAGNVSRNVILGWDSGGQTTSYDVYVGAAPTLTARDFQENTNTTTFDPGDLSPGATYYWRIDARGAGGVTTGPVWSFTTVGGVQPPQPVPGVTWKGIDSGTSAHLIEVAWNGTRFVAVGIDGTILHSRDGTAWTDSSISRGWLRGVASSSTRFVAVGGRRSEESRSAYGTIGTILHSRDGITWTEVRPHLDVTEWGGVAWNGERFVAVGTDGWTAHSRDGIAWTAADSGTSRYLIGVTWTGVQFVAVENGGLSVLHSPDGITWAKAPGAPVLWDVAWNGLRFVGVGNRGGVGAILHSTDGISWTDVSGAFGNTLPTLRGIAWSGTRFVAVGDRWSEESRSSYATILHSPDGGVSWTEVLLADSGIVADFIGGVAWSGSRFVAVGSGGTILVSP